jgi:hypothetical protein
MPGTDNGRRGGGYTSCGFYSRAIGFSVLGSIDFLLLVRWGNEVTQIFRSGSFQEAETSIADAFVTSVAMVALLKTTKDAFMHTIRYRNHLYARLPDTEPNSVEEVEVTTHLAETSAPKAPS